MPQILAHDSLQNRKLSRAIDYNSNAMVKELLDDGVSPNSLTEVTQQNHSSFLNYLGWCARFGYREQQESYNDCEDTTTSWS